MLRAPHISHAPFVYYDAWIAAVGSAHHMPLLYRTLPFTAPPAAPLLPAAGILRTVLGFRS